MLEIYNSPRRKYHDHVLSVCVCSIYAIYANNDDVVDGIK